MRANPGSGAGKQVRILDVTTQDGEIHPFYRSSTRDRTLTPANSLAGRWAPSRAALGAAFGAMARFPVTPKGRAAQRELTADGLCFLNPYRSSRYSTRCAPSRFVKTRSCCTSTTRETMFCARSI
jgi:hypothetical protein